MMLYNYNTIIWPRATDSRSSRVYSVSASNDDIVIHDRNNIAIKRRCDQQL